jgi:hypothetical protein
MDVCIGPAIGKQFVLYEWNSDAHPVLQFRIPYWPHENAEISQAQSDIFMNCEGSLMYSGIWRL